MRNIVLLGASGSIGTQTIDIVDQHSDLYKIIALSVGKNIKFMRKYLDSHELEFACVSKKGDAEALSKIYPNTTFYYGDEGLITLSKMDCDVLFNALQGVVGLLPTIEALKNKTDVACANKESLVAAGEIVMNLAKENGVSVIPVDSEHSAIFQTLQGYTNDDVNRLIITASGGAFKNKTREELVNVTVEDALRHPSWSMGAKITIDSATMMNKGFEVIEAHVLFGLPYTQIDVLQHPESIIHSMTEFKDHAVLAQLGVADMRLPIQYALTYPKRINNSSDSLSLARLGQLNFKNMDYERFPLLDLAYAVGVMGGNLLAILNGANETAVELFIEGKIKFLDIETLIFETVKAARKIYIENPDLQQIIEANQWAIDKVNELVKEL